MSDKIVDIISISSADGWWTEISRGEFKPLACWALVLRYDANYPSLSATKAVVGLTVDEIDIASDSDVYGRNYFHASEFEVVGRELK